MEGSGFSEMSSVGTPMRGVVGYSRTGEAEIFHFQRLAYPTRRADWVEPRWRWMFLSSATRLGITPMVWFYRGRDGLVAQQGAIPVRLKLGASERLTGWFVETITLESARGKAVGPMLIAKALEDLSFNLSLGQTEQMRAIQFGLGWQQVSPLPRYVLMLRCGAVLRGKIRPPLARWVAARILELSQAWRGRRRYLRRPRLCVEEIARFDEAHDRLWERVAAEYGCAVRRDASYLNWKYVEQPGQSFVRLHVRRLQDVVAVIVLSVLDSDHAYRYRRALIVEVVVSPTDDAAVHAALDAARRTALQRGADAIVLDLLNARLERAAVRYGFAARDPARVLLVATGGLGEEERKLVLDRAGWLVTRGDSDIDRPW